MRVTIDGADGRGAVDYTDALAPEGRLTIRRDLNKPSTCDCTFHSGGEGPSRLGRVVVSREDGTVLFTGYIPREPEAVYAGTAEAGDVYRLKMHAISDDWLLDKQGLRVGRESFSESGSALLEHLTQRVDGTRFRTSATGPIARVGRLRTKPEQSWSAAAGMIADASGAAYRVLGGEVILAALGGTQHTLPDTNDTLSSGHLQIAHTRDLVNDVTISGPAEAGTYITEIFVGDGSTTDFQLSSIPFRESSPTSQTLVADAFDTGGLDDQRWELSDPGSYLGLGSGGFTMAGGDGLDGQTTLRATTSVELGGCLVLEASSVILAQASDGVVLGLYNGATSRANCVAGFDVRQSRGATQVGCLAGGIAVGTTFTLASGHTYSMRVHLHSVEAQRVRQSFLVVLDGVPQEFGGGLVEAPLDLVFELRDMGMSSNTPAIVLYDGSLPNSPASASFVPVNSVELHGSIAEISVTRFGSVWIQGQNGGSPQTKIEGAAGTGADFAAGSNGVVRFFSGRVPLSGEEFQVRYRRSHRSVARVQAAASVQAEAKGGLPGIAAWRGSVDAPEVRSSEDCAAAAAAVLAIGADRPAALAGSYDASDLDDVWPGDLLTLQTDGELTTVMARQVRLVDGGAAPELLQYHVAFANDWAHASSIHLSHSFASDAVVPVPSSDGATVESLAALRVLSVSKSSVQIDTGSAPPSGGGFEVRSNDGGFRPGQGSDLVLRSLVRGLTIPRAAQNELFYVRMYDGSTPPVYSKRSSAVFINVPVQ